MKARYKHTDLIARDWQRLAKFYEDVFGCARVPPERHPSGEWLAKGTAVKGAGLLTFTYATDPEGNLLELQSWR